MYDYSSSRARENKKAAEAKRNVRPDCAVVSCPLVTQDPIIRPTGPPKDLKCGGAIWNVNFELPESAGEDGWIIQEIKRTLQIDAPREFTMTYHYWEAWPVKKNQKITERQKKYGFTDTYSQRASKLKDKGTHRVEGKAKFYEVELPPDFKQDNEETPMAGAAYATVHRPPFWDGTGTDHNLTSSWDCTAGSESKASEITTEP